MTREEAVENLKGLLESNYVDSFEDAENEALRMAIKALEQELIYYPLLDKIRAEIEEKYGDYDICEWCEEYDWEENDISEYRQVGKVSDILKIIDKYKAESEGMNE